MPLPLMNLDTRRWADLVEEGQALISRYAPSWTDHNIHDPGIMLMELLAWLTEREIYRVNRIPERHRRKFLALAGFQPCPPQAAQVVLGFTVSGPGSLNLPAGLTLQTTRPDGRTIPFQIARPTTLVPANIAAVQSFDGRNFKDLTGSWRDGLSLHPFGPDPASVSDLNKQPAFYLGLDAPLPGETAAFYFWLPEKLADELALILEEEQAAAERCKPNLPTANSCDDESDPSQVTVGNDNLGSSLPSHHDVSLVWECYDGADWQPLNVTDETRALTLSGAVHVDGPTAMSALSVGEISDPYFYLRLRLAAGRPDVAPLLTGLGLNMASAVQRQNPWTSLAIAPGVTPATPPQPGQLQPLNLALDENGVISALTAENGPECLVLSYQASTASQEGELIADLWPLNPGNGRPEQHFQLPAAPVDGQAQLWQDGTSQEWTIVPDFDASSRTDRHLLLDTTTGQITAGNGERGQVLADGSRFLVRYGYSQAAEGNVVRGSVWTLDGVADIWNEALLGQPVANLTAEINQISNIMPATGGAAAETLIQVAGRLAQTLWAHERLVELVPDGVETTLDQLDRTLVLNRKPPQRATTLLDIERLALSIPGTHVARARAWAGLDARYPCYKAPGTVSLIIIPALPLERPAPTAGLLQMVRSYLNRRRIVGMRLVVVGPQYVEVQIEALVRARSGADPARVQGDIESALDVFLDPLTGGPLGRGYPFGRNIYYAEMMQVIDNVSGVDHVLNLTLFADGGEGQCGNLCVGPINLPVPGRHTISVKASTE